MYKITANILVISAILLASCNTPSAELNSLQKLKEKKDSLKTELTKINSILKKVEDDIKKHSPRKKLYTVSVIKVTSKTFKHYVEVQGNVNSDKNITMHPELGGLVKKIYVKDGEHVKKNQILAAFDKSILEKSLSEIETALKLSETTYERQKKLWDQKIGSEMQYLQAKSNLESLKSKKAAIVAQIKQTEIRATFEGVIDHVFIKEGEMVAPTMPALRLINLKDIYIEADISEKYIKSIKKGSQVKVFFPNIDKNILSKIYMVGNFINSTNRTFRVVINIDNNGKEIRPNQLAILKILDLKEDGIVIPSNTILNSPTGESYVYTVKKEGNGYAVKKVIIKTGISYNGETIVYDGLTVEDTLVGKGSRSVQDGQEVYVDTVK